MEHLSSKTVAELKAYAQINNIDLDGANTKTKILAKILGAESSNISAPNEHPDAIVVPKREKIDPRSSSKSNNDGVVISGPAEKNYPPVKAEKSTKVPNEKIAVYSEKNLYWHGLGTLDKGYNIVIKEDAKKWLSHRSVREATPKEVATYYGKA